MVGLRSSLLHEPCCADREQERLSGCGAQAPHRGGFSCCGAQDLEHVGFRSCRSRALECRLSSRVAWTYLPHCMWNLPRSGIKHCLLNGRVDSLPLSHQGSPQVDFFLMAHYLNFYFLITSEVKHLYMTLLAFVCLLLWIVFLKFPSPFLVIYFSYKHIFLIWTLSLLHVLQIFSSNLLVIF